MSSRDGAACTPVPGEIGGAAAMAAPRSPGATARHHAPHVGSTQGLRPPCVEAAGAKVRAVQFRGRAASHICFPTSARQRPPASLSTMAGTFTDGKEGTTLAYAARDASGIMAPFAFTRCGGAAHAAHAPPAAPQRWRTHCRVIGEVWPVGCRTLALTQCRLAACSPVLRSAAKRSARATSRLISPSAASATQTCTRRVRRGHARCAATGTHAPQVPRVSR
jgi:hypothetical protein